jgi:hypothetical protein
VGVCFPLPSLFHFLQMSRPILPCLFAFTKVVFMVMGFSPLPSTPRP